MKQFSNVAAMTAAFLQAGTNQIVETKGYYNEGDGGAGRYLVMTLADYGKTPDEQEVAFTCASGNVAVLQVPSGMLLQDSVDGGIYKATLSNGVLGSWVKIA